MTFLSAAVTILIAVLVLIPVLILIAVLVVALILVLVIHPKILLDSVTAGPLW